jgi:hypothetical protein
MPKLSFSSFCLSPLSPMESPWGSWRSDR